MPPINLNESRQVLSDTGLHTLQIFTIAMMTAVAGFAGTVAFMWGAAGPPTAAREDATLLDFLSLLHLVTAVICYWLASALFTRRLTMQQEEEEAGDPTAQFRRLRAALVVRLALMEAPAYFGLAICLIAGVRGSLQHNPVYWLNLLSTLVFVLFAVQAFPSRRRVEYLLSKMAATREQSLS